MSRNLDLKIIKIVWIREISPDRVVKIVDPIVKFHSELEKFRRNKRGLQNDPKLLQSSLKIFATI